LFEEQEEGIGIDLDCNNGGLEESSDPEPIEITSEEVVVEVTEKPNTETFPLSSKEEEEEEEED
jgi:hypothetical protein